MYNDPTPDTGIATTATFDRIVQGINGESAVATDEGLDDVDDPSWYSTDRHVRRQRSSPPHHRRRRPRSHPWWRLCHTRQPGESILQP